MLSSNELSLLYKIISDENQTFENISQEFTKSFEKSDYLKIAISLYTLIKDNLLNVHQRLISFYILYYIQKSEQLEINPFLPLIIETIQLSKNKNEQSFLSDILLNQINYLNISVKNYIQDNSKTVKLNVPYIQKLYEKYNLEKNKLGNYIKINDYIRHIVYDRKKSDIKNIDNHPNIDISKSINIKNELSYNYFEPNYMSFCPMNANNESGKKFFNMEPVWVMPNLKHNFIWELEKKENLNDGEKK